ncbi:MAG: RHS repeat-associated core domain-containing protein [Acidobacteriia bacterium]|nr:RHS repeat-associated core domain-containing protein [Terriglobia bacterium]
MNTKNRVTSPGFTYDDAGNLTSDGSLTHTWDAENRLTSTNRVTYTYDGGGRRVKKSSGTLYWYGQDGKVLEETDLSGNQPRDYIYALGMLVGRQDGTPGNSTYTSFITDPLGSIRYALSGNTHAESDYYPFGGERVISNTLTTPNNYKFTGLERDSETGLDHTLFRQFSSNYGRWISPDPSPCCTSGQNPQDLNRYTYVVNNPTSEVDPVGLRHCRPSDTDCVSGPAMFGEGPVDVKGMSPCPMQFGDQAGSGGSGCDFYISPQEVFTTCDSSNDLQRFTIHPTSPGCYPAVFASWCGAVDYPAPNGSHPVRVKWAAFSANAGVGYCTVAFDVDNPGGGFDLSIWVVFAGVSFRPVKKNFHVPVECE